MYTLELNNAPHGHTKSHRKNYLFHMIKNCIQVLKNIILYSFTAL
jgi:hypothetical protein